MINPNNERNGVGLNKVILWQLVGKIGLQEIIFITCSNFYWDFVANLRLIPLLRERYGCKVGYSGHETGRILNNLGWEAEIGMRETLAELLKMWREKIRS